jgi:multidrug transporter EmrE-like cation transporter
MDVDFGMLGTSLNAADKNEEVIFMEPLVLFLVVGDILLNAGAHVSLKMGMSSKGLVSSGRFFGTVQRILLNPFVLGGMAAYVCSFVFYAALLSKMDLSLAFPLCTSAAFLLVLAASVLLFRERLNRRRTVGAAAILVGILLISL